MRLPPKIYLLMLLALGAASSLHSQPRITYPNGGEFFYPGQDILIRWEGADSIQVVGLEYSSDGGDSWKSITAAASGLQHPWRVPQYSSDRYLVRALYTSGGPQAFEGPSYEIYDVGYSSDERLIMAHSFLLGGLIVKDRNSGATRWQVEDAKWGRPSPAHNVAVTVSRKIAVLRNMETGAVIDTLREAAGNVNNARFTPDGSLLVSVGTDGAVMVWNGVSGAYVKTLGNHTSNVSYARFSGDSRRIVTLGQSDATLKVWDLQSGKQVQSIALTSNIRAAALSPDGTRVAGASDGGAAAQMWDVATGNRLFTMPGRRKVVFSPDGAQILVGPGSEETNVYNASDGALLHTFTHNGKGFGDAYYSSDGERIALLHDDGDISLWNARTGELEKTLKANGSTINCLEFSKDGRYIISGGRDNTIRLWDLQGAQSGTDVSDAPFTIWPPTLAISMLDMGNTPYGYRRDSTVTAVIRNPDTRPLLVGNLRFSGADSTSFSLIGEITSLEVPANGSADIAVRFTPSAARAHQAVLQFDAHGMGYQLQLRGSGVKMDLVPQVDAIDFGKVPVKATRDTIVTAVVRNMTREEIRIDSVTVLPGFYLQTPTSWRRDTVIAPGGVLGLRLSFSASSPWLYRRPLQIFYSGRDSLTIFAIAESIVPASVSYQAGSGNGGVLVQPNPASSWVDVRVGMEGPGLVRATVCDLLGAVRKEDVLRVDSEGAHYVRIDVSDLPSGRYLLVIDIPSGKKSVPLSIVR